MSSRFRISISLIMVVLVLTMSMPITYTRGTDLVTGGQFAPPDASTPAPDPPLTTRPPGPVPSFASIGPFGIPNTPDALSRDVFSGPAFAIALDPSNANTIYLGAIGGGLWKSTNGGASWSVLTDVQLVRTLPSDIRRGTDSIKTIAIDGGAPQNVYIGTGELGVFRSLDGGLNWTPLGISFSAIGCSNDIVSQADVSRIILHDFPSLPGESNSVLFAATSKGLFSYQLDDSSDCFRTTGPAASSATDIVDDGVYLFAAFSGQGIYRSLDGFNWQLLASGRPSQGFGGIAMAISSPTETYALYAGYAGITVCCYNGNPYEAEQLWVSHDRGDTWSQSLPIIPQVGQPLGTCDNQCFWNNVVAVGPHSSDDVYVGQVGLWKASDGGRSGSWTGLSCCLASGNPNIAGLDLHADLHAVVFAPLGSYTETSSVYEIIYLANDGGITKGVMNSAGVVTWQSLNHGLAISQCGTIGVATALASLDEVSCGLWHIGNVLLDSRGFLQPEVIIGGGDGYQSAIDNGGGSLGGTSTVYYNCNAGFGGSICRAHSPSTATPHVWGTVSYDGTIWSTSNPTVMWSDPYREGVLLRLEPAGGGTLYRALSANTLSASDLNSPSAWAPIDPPSKTGSTTTIAFKVPALNEGVIYYLGTSTGEIWRGPGNGEWQKLPTLSSSPVNGIAEEYFPDNPSFERIFVVFSGAGPARIEEITLTPNTNDWVANAIDGNFLPVLAVNDIRNVVVQPVESTTSSPTVFVGTDQGLYYGRPASGVWYWARALGIPNVLITDLKALQNTQAGVSEVFAGTGGVGAGGRGVFKLHYMTGDVFASTGSSVQWFRSDGTVKFLNTRSTDSGMAFDLSNNLFVTGFNGQTTYKFDCAFNSCASLGTFGGGYAGFPESVTFDASGNAYVGQVPDTTGGSTSPPGNHFILKFDSSGNKLAEYNVAVDSPQGVGSDWVDMAADQCTIFYTSEGLNIQRFNVCTNTQLPAFNRSPLSHATALALLPDGGLIVANELNIVRLDSQGYVVQTYSQQGVLDWFSLALDPDGTSFWGGDISSSAVITKFDINSGNVLLTFRAVPTGDGVSGLAVFGEMRVGQNPPPNRPPSFDVPPSPPSGSTFMRVTGDSLGFVVQCSDPDIADSVMIGNLGLPQGGTFTIPNPSASTNPVAGIFEWTPSAAQWGSGSITFTCTDNNGNSAPSLTVKYVVTSIRAQKGFFSSIDTSSLAAGGLPGTPLPTDANGNFLAQAITRFSSRVGGVVVVTSIPGTIYEVLTIQGAGHLSPEVRSFSIQDMLPINWNVGNGGVNVLFVDSTTMSVTDITGSAIIGIQQGTNPSTGQPGNLAGTRAVVSLRILDVTASNAAGKELAPRDEIVVIIKMTYAIKGFEVNLANYPVVDSSRAAVQGFFDPKLEGNVELVKASASLKVDSILHHQP